MLAIRWNFPQKIYEIVEHMFYLLKRTGPRQRKATQGVSWEILMQKNK